MNIELTDAELGRIFDAIDNHDWDPEPRYRSHWTVTVEWDPGST